MQKAENVVTIKNTREIGTAREPKEDKPEQSESTHRDELNDDTSHHDVCSMRSVSQRIFISGSRCASTPNGLNDNRDDIEGYKNGKVHSCGYKTVAAAVLRDHPAKDVIDGGTEETRRCTRQLAKAKIT